MKLYELTDDELAKKVNSKWRKSRTDQSDWIKEAKESFNFVASHQWEDEDIKKLEKEGRPVVTFNRCNPILSAILGMEANQRQQTSFLPRDTSDTGLCDAIDVVCKWSRDYAEIPVEESQAFEDMLTCGMGWTDSYINYEVDLDGKIIQEVFNPLEASWDASSRKRNLTDAEWIARSKKMSVDDIEERWPEANIEITEDMLKTDDDVEEDKITYVDPTDRYGEGSKSTQKGRKPSVIQFQWFEKIPVYRVAMPMSGEIHQIPESKFKKMKKMLDENKAKYIRQYQRIYYQSFSVGETLLEKSKLPCQTGFTLKCITGKHDKIQNCWYGIVRLMKDPQRWANKFFSSFMDIIESNAKGGLMVEENAVSDTKKFEESWAETNSITWLRPGALAQGRLKEKPAPLYPQAVDRLLQFAVQSIYDCTGMNMEMLGLADRAQANVLEETRKRSAYTILAPFFDSLHQYRKESGILLLEFITYLPLKRIEEVLEDKLKPYANQIKNIDLRQINIIVSESPQSDNHKAIVWTFLSNVVPQLLKMGMPIPPEILDYSPLPAPLVAKWKTMLPGGDGKPQIPPELKAQMDQMNQMLQELQQENQQLKSKRDEKMAELSLKKEMSDMDRELEKQKIQADFEMQRQENEMKMAQFFAELQAKTSANIEATKIEAETKMKSALIDLEAKKDAASPNMKSGEIMDKHSQLTAKMILELIKAMNTPKEIVRDKSGRSVGVRVVSTQ